VKSFKNFIVQFFILFIIWILINNSFDTELLITGFVFSIVASSIFCFKCDVFSDIKLTPKALIYTILYIFVFIIELIKSNFDVAYRVVSPSLPINPGIVAVKTKLKSKMGRMILTNSITLTPGTLTVDIIEDTLYIHWIDVKTVKIEEATKDIVSHFEKYLEVIYG